MSSDFETLFKERFPKFGTNKAREVQRLIFEISSIENIPPEAVFAAIKENSYETVKKMLLTKRYPETFGKVPMDSFYLPKFDANKQFAAGTNSSAFNPQTVYYEEPAVNFPVFDRVKNKFPDAAYIRIESMKDFMRGKKFTLTDFNSRTKNLFLTGEKYDFFKRCPCTSGVVNCGYSIMNTGMGCAYECSYCFLQGYQNVPGIVIPYNIKEYLKEDRLVSSAKGFFNYKRIGSGEFTDSLIFDDITEFSSEIIHFFKEKPDIFFEFKTKSVNIENLLRSGGKENIVAAWSVNSEKIRKENEFKAPSVAERLAAAKKCADAGFSTAFHFDPIVYYSGWEKDYSDTVDMIFDIVPAGSIKWISLGTLRMPASLKTVIENRFPDTKILNGELLLGNDYKLRYEENLRAQIYSYMNNLIKSKKTNTVVYLCMEESCVWKKSGMI